MAETAASMLQSSMGASESNSQKHTEKANEDRISGLPDKVLSHILSFLPTKYAVGTSILSTRWRYLWISVPNLDLDDMLLFDPDKSPRILPCDFENFVNRVLILGSVQSIKKFRLKYVGRYESSVVNAWICSAILRNVEELDLCVMMGQGTVPLSLFSYNKLVVLKLSSEIVLNVPDSVSFSSLKVLHLKSLQCLDDASIQKVISGSAVLEELVIIRDYADNVRTLSVHSPSLKKLTIHTTMLDTDKNDDYRVIVDTPNLEFLELIDRLSKYKVTDLPLLIKAKIEVGARNYSTEKLSAYRDMLVQLYRKISNIKVLVLSGRMLSALFEALGNNLPDFNNLTHLEVTVATSGWLNLPSILKCSPNLKWFTLNKSPTECMWCPPQTLTRCLSCLLVVELNGFSGIPAELEMVEYFLGHALALKKMSIYSNITGSKGEADVLKKLLMFPRASTSCRIAFF